MGKQHQHTCAGVCGAESWREGAGPRSEPSLGLRDGPEGWNGGGGEAGGKGECVQLWLIHVVVWQRRTQHCKKKIFLRP